MRWQESRVTLSKDFQAQARPLCLPESQYRLQPHCPVPSEQEAHNTAVSTEHRAIRAPALQ